MTDRRVWASLSLVVVLALILGVYYWVHKPATYRQAEAIGSTLANFGVAILLTLVGGGLGRQLVGEGEIASPGERVTLHVTLGWGVMGLAMWALGMVGLYFPVLIWVVAVLACLALWRNVRGWLADLARALGAMWSPVLFIRLASLFVWFALVLGLLRALAPPVMWDALVYHLTLPKLYAQAHGLQIDADILFSGMPQLTEMLYTAAILLRGEIAAQTLGWVFGAVLAVGLAAHATEILAGDSNTGLLAPAILYSALTISFLLSWAYADLLLMLITLALLIVLRQWRLSTSRRWLWMGGVLAGMAIGCKYTGVLVPLGGVGMIVLGSTAGRRLSARAREAALFGGITCVVLAPWLIKNWILTGSPVYPLLIPAGHMDALRQWFYSRPDTGERNPLWAALIFLRASFWGVQSSNDYDATLGPLFVFLLLGLAVGWRRLNVGLRNELRPLVIFMLVGYTSWVLLLFASNLALQVRLFFALFPVMALVCTAGLAAIVSFDAPALRVSVIVSAALCLVLGLTALENLTAFAGHGPLGYLVGVQSAVEYREANLGAYAEAMDRINTLPAGSQVEFLWEARSLECVKVRCMPDVVIDRWWHLRRSVGPASVVISRWKAQGITHVLIYDTGQSFVRSQADAAFVDSDWVELDALRGQLRFVKDIRGVYSLYELP